MLSHGLKELTQQRDRDRDELARRVKEFQQHVRTLSQAEAGVDKESKPLKENSNQTSYASSTVRQKASVKSGLNMVHNKQSMGTTAYTHKRMEAWLE